MSTATAAKRWPGYVCWSSEWGYFAQFLDTWRQRNGVVLTRDDLYIGDTPMFRVVDEVGLVYDCNQIISVIDQRYWTEGYVCIHLADDEWGNETMYAVAREYFDEHEDCQFIEVYEHGGWFLGWRRDGSIWCTANDMAVLQKTYPIPTGAIHTIRRGQ